MLHLGMCCVLVSGYCYMYCVAFSRILNAPSVHRRKYTREVLMLYVYKYCSVGSSSTLTLNFLSFSF
jgi:hypothetical protein